MGHFALRFGVQGAIYARVKHALNDRRISQTITYDRSRTVDIAADLGRADTCALWFAQQWGMEHRFIDYYSGFGQDWGHYLGEIQRRGYRVGKFYLPRCRATAAKKSIAAPQTAVTAAVVADKMLL